MADAAVRSSMTRRNIFITGGTGYLGRRSIPELIRRGHQIRALVRAGSERKLPRDCQAISGDALKKQSFAAAISPSDTFIQLVGVPHPSPAKAKQFREIDLVSALASIAAAKEAGLQHFIYVSVAQPAPMMKEYQAVRAEAEAALRASGMNATILRPWYILGPGHWWPCLILPGYWLCELLPSTRESARRLGLVTLKQMIAALVQAVEKPASGVEIVEVPRIRQAAG
jgi:uncharacterized protein YbjT (DUF2867 family)